MSRQFEYYVGDIVNGHTYLVGDFHSQLKGKIKVWHLGMPKLRTGVVLERKHPFYKIQFQNHSAKDYPYKNEIHCRISVQRKIQVILGRDSYCQWVHYSKIKGFVAHSEILDYEEILAQARLKHSKEKKSIEKKILSGDFFKFELSKQQYFLQDKQFSKKEKQHWMSDEQSCLKIELLSERLKNPNLDSKRRIKIYKRIIEASDWIKGREIIPDKIQKIINKAVNETKLVEENKNEQ